MSRARRELAPERFVEYLPWWKAVVLGLVEGATEFIPVSSTGHLILAGDWLDFTGPAAATFEIVIQLGAILAVLWLYRVKVLGSVVRWRTDATARRFLLNLIISFIPAAALGFLIHDFIKEKLFDPLVVAISLVLGGIAILVIERWHRRPAAETVDDITPGLALGIGLAQTLSLIPGVSRSGATIMGAVGLGASRKAATEFSFFLAIPVMFAATIFELVGSLDMFTADLFGFLAIGFVVSFVSAIVIVKAFIGFVSRHSFALFAWYRIVFGIVLLLYYWR